jgi:uncharacterized membrane protein (UPF0136 family)
MLVPGVLITLPPGASILISGLVHAVVFYVVQAYLAQYVPWWGIWIAAVVLVGLRMYMSRPAVPTYGY